MNDHKQYKTLVDAIVERAGSEQSITFITGQDAHDIVSFARMYQRACARLAVFQAAGIQSGHHLIIQCNDNALFIEGFWACLLGGIVAVPVSGGNSAEHRLKLFRIAGMLENAALYTDTSNRDRILKFASEHALADQFTLLQARCCLADEPAELQDEPVLASVEPEHTAFIQFSSGSTSTPKGIVLNHHNLISNTGSIIDGCLMSQDDHLLSWMPLTHDMGLIGFHLTPLVCDTSHSLMPTDVFVRRPGLWLSEAQAVGASILCSPNFGYQHFLKSFKPEKNASLDLSCVRLLFNGAEPISVSLCKQFMQTMSEFGLHGNAMMPVYGLAEASLAVSFPDLNNRFTTLTLDRASLLKNQRAQTIGKSCDGANGVQLVSVGKPVSLVQLTIRNDDDQDIGELMTGRICIRGPNVTAGYYKEPQLNAQMIDANGWLDTGDLGLIHEQQLYITGRAKDIIFINGQNVYPHDLEEILIQQGIAERGKIAIASDSGTEQVEEQLLVFLLHRSAIEELEQTARDITRELGSQAGVRVASVVAVPRIPKTTSGKVQRFELVRQYQAAELESLEQLASEDIADNAQSFTASVSDDGRGIAVIPTGNASTLELSDDASTQDRLLALCRSHIEGTVVAVDDNLFELGISSLTLAEIHASIEETWPDKVDITDLFDYPTVAELAGFLDQHST